MPSKLKPLFFVCVAALCLGAALMAIAQGAKVRPELDAGDSDNDHPAERRQWFREGRTVPGKSAADFLQRAYRQKMQLRAANRAQASAVATSVSVWQNLGPNPLISDPTGFQSYGPVTGRTTSVAIDQNDPSGNTVHIGCDFGCVWNSNNVTA